MCRLQVKIAIKWLFAPFVMLMIVVTLRYIWRIYTVLRFGPPETEIDLLVGEVSDDEEAKQ